MNMKPNLSEQSNQLELSENLRLVKIFRALADPTRLAILDTLTRGPATVKKLGRNAEMSLPSFLQHLDLLEEAGIVRSRKNSRNRVYRLMPHSLRSAERWLAKRRPILTLQRGAF